MIIKKYMFIFLHGCTESVDVTGDVLTQLKFVQISSEINHAFLCGFVWICLFWKKKLYLPLLKLYKQQNEAAFSLPHELLVRFPESADFQVQKF